MQRDSAGNAGGDWRVLYAPPEEERLQGCWRGGRNRVCVADGADFPPFCVYCGSGEDVLGYRRRFRGHLRAWAYAVQFVGLLLLFGLFLFSASSAVRLLPVVLAVWVLMDVFGSKRVRVRMFVCGRHRILLRRLRVGFVLSLVLLLAAVFFGAPVWLLLAASLPSFCLLLLLNRFSLIRLRYREHGVSVFTGGFGRRFLARLPETPH